MTDLTHIKRSPSLDTLRLGPGGISQPYRSLGALPASNWFTESAASPEAVPYIDDSEKWRDYLTNKKVDHMYGAVFL